MKKKSRKKIWKYFSKSIFGNRKFSTKKSFRKSKISITKILPHFWKNIFRFFSWYFFSEFFSRSKKNNFCWVENFFYGIASMQKVEIFRFMRVSERFRHSFIGFGGISFIFLHFFHWFLYSVSLSQGPNPILGLKKLHKYFWKKCEFFFGPKQNQEKIEIFWWDFF